MTTHHATCLKTVTPLKPQRTDLLSPRLQHGMVVLMIGLFATACAVLPSGNTRSLSKWETYADANKAFDTIVVDQTSKKDIQFLGFTPEGNPNVKILNYVDVANLFGSAFRAEDLPKGVKTCIAAQDKCVAYVTQVRNVQSTRNGNVAADLFGFRKRTHITGFEFQATLVLVNDEVIYKLWNGVPEVESYEKQNTPLGPFQNLSGIIPKPY